MKTASMLVNPTKYMAAYTRGKQDAMDKKPYQNGYHHVYDREEYGGYDDGYYSIGDNAVADMIIQDKI